MNTPSSPNLPDNHDPQQCFCNALEALINHLALRAEQQREAIPEIKEAARLRPTPWNQPLPADALQERFSEELDALVREFAIKQNNLTRQQLAEAIRQAFDCGDFQRCVFVSPGKEQEVTYQPYRLLQQLAESRDELRTQVERLQAQIDSAKHQSAPDLIAASDSQARETLRQHLSDAENTIRALKDNSIARSNRALDILNTAVEALKQIALEIENFHQTFGKEEGRQA